MKALTILVPMKLGGQGKPHPAVVGGYAMAALLIAMSAMAIVMTVAMPVWKQMAQREKETELVFRGEQYAHAIGMFQKKYANAYPPSFDVLVTEKFLRKKFKDPITNDDFAPILVGQNNQGGVQAGSAGASSTPGGTPTRGIGPGVGGAPTPPTSPGGRSSGPGVSAGPGGPGGGTAGGGIMGVTSKSKDKSIRIYKGRSHYNEWQFVYVPQAQAPGAGAPGAGGPGGPGSRGSNPSNPGGGIGGRGGRGAPGPGGRGFGPGGQQPPQPPGRGGPGGMTPFGRGR
jgi:type II secretory pathway pseudopilin PulG